MYVLGTSCFSSWREVTTSIPLCHWSPWVEGTCKVSLKHKNNNNTASKNTNNNNNINTESKNPNNNNNNTESKNPNNNNTKSKNTNNHTERKKPKQQQQQQHREQKHKQQQQQHKAQQKSRLPGWGTGAIQVLSCNIFCLLMCGEIFKCFHNNCILTRFHLLRFVNIGVSTATQGNLFPNAGGAGRHVARQEWSPKIGIRRKRLLTVLSPKGTPLSWDVRQKKVWYSSKVRSTVRCCWSITQISKEGCDKTVIRFASKMTTFLTFSIDFCELTSKATYILKSKQLVMIDLWSNICDIYKMKIILISKKPLSCPSVC